MDSLSLNLTEVVELARRLDKPVIGFDFETTTFRGQENFGVWQAAFIAVTPSGLALAYGETMDPEAPLSPEVQALCGKTDAELRGLPTYDKRVLGHFAEYAEQAWFGGFNTKTFDVPAAKDMARRYSQPEPNFLWQFDVRQLHHHLMATDSRKGNLQQVAKAYGVEPRGMLHSAPADVALTMETLNAQLKLFGHSKVIAAMVELNKPTNLRKSRKRQLSCSALVSFMQGKRHVTVEEVAKYFQAETNDVAFEIGRAIDERLIDAMPFAQPEAQEWLDLTLPLLSDDARNAGRLKRVLGEVKDDNAPPGLDYVQLRIGMLRNGLRWSSLSPQ